MLSILYSYIYIYIMVRYYGRARQRVGSVNTNQPGLKQAGCPGTVGKKGLIIQYLGKRVNCNLKTCGLPMSGLRCRYGVGDAIGRNKTFMDIQNSNNPAIKNYCKQVIGGRNGTYCQWPQPRNRQNAGGVGHIWTSRRNHCEKTCALGWQEGARAAAPAKRENSSPVHENEMIHVPGGRLVHKDCVHEVPSGTITRTLSSGELLLTFPDGTTQIMPPCPHELRQVQATDCAPNCYPIMLWSTAINDPSPPTLDSFKATYTVPSMDVAKADETVYLWTGVQPPPPGAVVLQPVLGWDNGKTWNAASWNCCPGGGHAMRGPNINVEAGDSIKTSIAREEINGKTGMTVRMEANGEESVL